MIKFSAISLAFLCGAGVVMCIAIFTILENKEASAQEDK